MRKESNTRVWFIAYYTTSSSSSAAASDRNRSSSLTKSGNTKANRVQNCGSLQSWDLLGVFSPPPLARSRSCHASSSLSFTRCSASVALSLCWCESECCFPSPSTSRRRQGLFHRSVWTHHNLWHFWHLWKLPSIHSTLPYSAALLALPSRLAGQEALYSTDRAALRTV